MKNPGANAKRDPQKFQVVKTSYDGSIREFGLICPAQLTLPKEWNYEKIEYPYPAG
jgi:hypothetical protein